jgi:hypothetical protein
MSWNGYLATTPTLIKCYKHPETETKLSYVLFAVCCIVNLVNIETWSYTESAYPVYLAVANSALVVSVYYKKIRMRR